MHENSDSRGRNREGQGLNILKQPQVSKFFVSRADAGAGIG
ncbi:hypothetical protein AmDm5_2717 [Acetobacter malorum]|nr:hypothetical protein AmDm5_2717 [Acetobacter malorum]